MTEALNLDELLVAAFERAAATFPTRIAIGSTLWEPSYRELNGTANRLAHRLIGRGIVPGDRVAILMAHDAPLFAAVLGTLKAGSIVVALDPDDPISRLQTLIEDFRICRYRDGSAKWEFGRGMRAAGLRYLEF